MRLVLDSGALIALERNNPNMWRRWKAAALQDRRLITHGGVVGQAWRGNGPRQARLAGALEGIHVAPLDRALGRAAGELLARVKLTDVIDAALVLLARDGDQILTSDPLDIAALASAANRQVEIILV